MVWTAAFLAAALVTGCSGESVAPGAVTPGTSSSGAPTSGPAATAGPAAGVAQQLRSDVARGPAGQPGAAGPALDSLGAALLRQLPAGENAVLSPYSIYAVLAMARAGAKGATAAQLDTALGGSAAAQTGNVTAVDRAVAAALAASKPPAGSDPQTTDARPEVVDVANSLWLSPSLPVRQSYLDALASGFGVGMYQIDYAAGPEAARRAINGWVAQHTEELIPELLSQGDITNDTLLTLVNALYFSAPWQMPLDKSETPLSFTTAAGKKISAPAFGTTTELATATGKGWTSVTIPYRGGGLAMTLVLPDPGAYPAVRAALPTVLRAAVAAKDQVPVRLSVPLFKSQTHLSLKAAMKVLGVKDIFELSADLSGIASNPGDIYSSDLVHQSVISVDEKGTEAAAATAMMMVPTSGFGENIAQITLDRPFFYSIHDTATGAPLFLGQITDPTA